MLDEYEQAVADSEKSAWSDEPPVEVSSMHLESDNPWRRTADELPAEGQVVEGRGAGSEQVNRYIFAFKAWRSWRSLVIWPDPFVWRYVQGESE